MRVTDPCTRSVTYVRIQHGRRIVSTSLQSEPEDDTEARNASRVEYVAVGAAPARATPLELAPWPVAFRRLLRTATELLDCRRELLAIRSEMDQPEHFTATRRASLLRTIGVRMGTRMRLHVEVHGPVPCKPSVLVANHMSYLDPIAIGSVLPLSAVAKSEITRWPAVGLAIEELGAVFVRRGDAMSGALALRKAIRVLKAGVPILVFPEGTTTYGDDVLPFSRGAFGIARLLRMPVVPVTLRYDTGDACWVGSATLMPHLLKLHRHDRVRADVIFGPPLEPMAFPDASSLAAATRSCIRSLVLP